MFTQAVLYAGWVYTYVYVMVEACAVIFIPFSEYKESCEHLTLPSEILNDLPSERRATLVDIS